LFGTDKDLSTEFRTIALTESPVLPEIRRSVAKSSSGTRTLSLTIFFMLYAKGRTSPHAASQRGLEPRHGDQDIRFVMGVTHVSLGLQENGNGRSSVPGL
jgi:hypothetical protein